MNIWPSRIELPGRFSEKTGSATDSMPSELFGFIWLTRVLHRAETPPSESMLEGVELSIVLAEAEPVGGFVGTSISEPLLQIGILVTVGSYLIYLQPLMMLAVAATFAPQIAFVPMLQAAINRRVEAKVAIMRDVSEGMVHAIERGED